VIIPEQGEFTVHADFLSCQCLQLSNALAFEREIRKENECEILIGESVSLKVLCSFECQFSK
jgi:hypothetical protein